ncbi:histidine phosphatase family protein [Thiomicrorhabdus sp. zzn3]|uniref:histidine phosphatase family protein n=1 Tax=Thiomicrorhabdus sp. zzn3 TaxID=3039775 RepID=UPI00243652C7|nr:histidine phosphatase family protein [Thiomicrorhabdus sp. zzn3]MDG6778534.1 histidine phosphatase family protein [Thiomicrorhabdus sp. zzn3]
MKITWGLSVLMFFAVHSVFADENKEEAFWQALQEGGKVVLIRHAEIDREFGDAFILDDSCFSERNLNATGKQQAKRIGEAFRQHRIKINQVLSSPHCRTRDTAQEAFGTYHVEPKLRLIKALSTQQAEANMHAIRSLIANYQSQGNLILVTHRPNIGELIYQRVEPAEMVLIEPLGDGQFDLIARLRLQD